jgi:hypothetical protein
MHNNNHTPGPWAKNAYRVFSDAKRIAEIDTAYMTHDETHSNARLIAAAPCMLLALTIARAHIRRALEEIPENDGNLSGALAVIGEAITKATGGDFE